MDDDVETVRLKLGEVNKNLTCGLCDGYLIDATTIIECLHSFCRTCIVTYLKTSKTCPKCETLVHKTRPHLNIRSDKLLQDLVFKIVPGLYKDEMKRRREFYTLHYEDAPKRPTEERGDEMSDRFVFNQEEHISFALHYCPHNNAERIFHRIFKTKEEFKARLDRKTKDSTYVRYFQCKAAVCIRQLKKLIRLKFDLPSAYQIDVLYNDELLKDSYSLADVALSCNWRRNAPLRLNFSMYEMTMQKVATGEDVPRLTHSTALRFPIPLSTVKDDSCKNSLTVSSAPISPPTSPSPIICPESHFQSSTLSTSSSSITSLSSSLNSVIKSEINTNVESGHMLMSTAPSMSTTRCFNSHLNDGPSTSSEFTKLSPLKMKLITSKIKPKVEFISPKKSSCKAKTLDKTLIKSSSNRKNNLGKRPATTPILIAPAPTKKVMLSNDQQQVFQMAKILNLGSSSLSSTQQKVSVTQSSVMQQLNSSRVSFIPVTLAPVMPSSSHTNVPQLSQPMPHNNYIHAMNQGGPANIHIGTSLTNSNTQFTFNNITSPMGSTRPPEFTPPIISSCQPIGSISSTKESSSSPSMLSMNNVSSNTTTTICTSVVSSIKPLLSLPSSLSISSLIAPHSSVTSSSSTLFTTQSSVMSTGLSSIAALSTSLSSASSSSTSSLPSLPSVSSGCLIQSVSSTSPTPAASASPTPAAVPSQQSQTQGTDSQPHTNSLSSSESLPSSSLPSSHSQSSNKTHYSLSTSQPLPTSHTIYNSQLNLNMGSTPIQNSHLVTSLLPLSTESEKSSLELKTASIRSERTLSSPVAASSSTKTISSPPSSSSTATSPSSSSGQRKNSKTKTIADIANSLHQRVNANLNSHTEINNSNAPIRSNASNISSQLQLSVNQHTLPNQNIRTNAPKQNGMEQTKSSMKMKGHQPQFHHPYLLGKPSLTPHMFNIKKEMEVGTPMLPATSLPNLTNNFNLRMPLAPHPAMLFRPSPLLFNHHAAAAASLMHHHQALAALNNSNNRDMARVEDQPLNLVTRDKDFRGPTPNSSSVRQTLPHSVK